MVELIITEKPAQAEKIAEALADGKPHKVVVDRVAYYEITHKDKDILVGCAVGHLYSLAEKKKKGLTYPVFDIEWKPAFEIKKASAFSEKYLNVLKKLAKKADAFIVACDYDIEGCLPGFEKILINDQGITRLVSIEEFFNQKCKNKLRWKEFEYIELDKSVSTPGINFETFDFKFTPVNKVMRRKGDGSLFRITLENGREVHVSKNHPFYVLTPNGVIVKRTSELQLEDYIPISKELPLIEPTCTTLDLIELLKENQAEKFYVYGWRSFINKMPAELATILGVKRKTCLGWRFFDRMPLSVYLRLEEDKKYRKHLRIGIQRGQARIPVLIHLNGNLGRLLGYYLAEGCMDTSNFIGFYFGPHELDIVDEVKDLFASEFQLHKIKFRFLPPNHSGFKPPAQPAPEVGTKCKMLGVLFKTIFRLGRTAHVKRLPNFIFSAPPEFCIGLLDAYLLGDGSLFWDGKSSRYVVSAGSMSKELISDIHLLLLRYGINASLVHGSDGCHRLTIPQFQLKRLMTLGIFSLFKRQKVSIENEHTNNSPTTVLPNFLLKDCEVTSFAQHNMKYGKRTSLSSLVQLSDVVERIVSNGIHFLRVTKIREEPYGGYFYDLETETSSFLHGNGIVTHNSLIGFNVLRFACGKKDAKRMKFSTLTKDELRESYEKASAHLDFPLIEAGETRHMMDYFWGISLSRALMASIKAAGSFKIMSAGRVQGPALKIVVDREHEIKNFKPEPFWQLELKTKEFSAWHKKDKFFDRKEFDQVLQRTKGKDAAVVKLSTSEVRHAPPFPFDLTTLQTESYRYFGISPKETLSIAQDLYTAGLISYPRTSSQKLPHSLGFKKIMNGLSKQTEYKAFCDELSKGKMLPNEGNKTDPAHPAIFPTGEKKKITDRSKKIYDLIVRRFLATFSIPAVRETLTADINVGEEPFVAKGMRTLKKGWYEIYYFPKLKEEELPKLKEGQKLYPYELITHDEQTQPPNRYNQASLIKALEKLEIGTKSTRAAIIDNLYQRNYIMEKAIVATELGMKTVETLGKYSPEILDPELTRHFEHDMDAILEQKHHQEETLEDAKKELTKILDKFRKHEKEVGIELLAATRLTQDTASTIGPCAVCKEGTMMIRRGRFGLFIACNKYPKCKTTSSLPKNSTMVKPTEKSCETCKHPIVIVFRKGKRPFNYCTNKQCPIKLEWIKQQQEKKNNLAAPAA